ncbi:MAG: winged helix-turn-helix domain-containing protein [Smithella sp.]
MPAQVFDAGSAIQKQIMNGTITPGSKLPPEREMAETFSVNRATVREALRKLENLDGRFDDERPKRGGRYRQNDVYG